MERLIHFAKVFGITWAIVMAIYVVMIHRVGFAVGWRGQSAPPMWVLQFISYAWPGLPAILVAGLGELTRAATVWRY